MSFKKRLGIKGISNCEIIRRIKDAQSNNLDEVDFVSKDGSVIRVHLTHLEFDPFMFEELS